MKKQKQTRKQRRLPKITEAEYWRMIAEEFAIKKKEKEKQPKKT